MQDDVVVSKRVDWQILVEIMKRAGLEQPDYQSAGDVYAELASLSDKSDKALLTAILSPNAALEDKYAAYSITTGDDESLLGMLEAEAGGSITIRLSNGEQRQLLRRRGV